IIRVDIKVLIKRGGGAKDPQQPGQSMFLYLPAVELAGSCHAEIGITCFKNKKHRCQFFEYCGYQRQLRDHDGVQVWIVATDTLFHAHKALGKPIATIIDEKLWQKGITGIEASEDWSVAINSLSNPPPPSKRHHWTIGGYGPRELELLDLRERLANALRAQENDGGVERKYLDARHLDGTSCTLALGLEWERYTTDLKKLGQHPGMSEAQLT